MLAGHEKLVLKRDGERSMTAFKDAVKVACDTDTGVESSSVGDSKANGEAEKGV